MFNTMPSIETGEAMSLRDQPRVLVSATPAQSPPEVQQLRTLCLSLLSMLTDLNKGYPWRELHIDLDQCMKTAAELGVPIDELEEA